MLSLLFVACATDPGPDTHTAQPGDTGDSGETGDTGDTGVADGCRATPAAADRERAVVLSFPYDGRGRPADTWAVLRLDVDGGLSAPGDTFTLGRATSGVVAFAPDGSLGVVPQEDGTLGVFTLDAELAPTVVEAAWAGPGGADFYAGAVVFDPSGERAFVVDGNWENNGGGIYEVAFDCESGAPTLVGQRIASKLAAAVYPTAGGGAVLVAAGAAGQEGADAWLLAGWPDAPTVSASATLFDYEDAILGGSALAGDTLLVGDTSMFSGTDNRVAAARVGDGIEAAANPTVLEDPFAMVASPDGDAVLVSSGFGDALWVLEVADGLVRIADELDAPGVALPGSSVVIARGGLRGLALVVENVAVRRVQFDGEGGAADLGTTDFGDAYTSIPGAVGVQP